MKKALKAFVAWLDRKFPDKAPYTPADAEKLKSCFAGVLLLEDRMKKAEAEINKFNVSLGFMGGGIGNKMGPFQR